MTSEVDPAIRQRAERPVELQVYQLAKAMERLFDSRIAEININCRDPHHLVVNALLKPEIRAIDIHFSIDL